MRVIAARSASTVGIDLGIGQRRIGTAQLVDQSPACALVERVARGPVGSIEARDRFAKNRIVVGRLHAADQRIGGAYRMPPLVQSWLMPRGMPSFD